MLSSLTIENVALIDNVHIEFNNGLNILTGETGAGKSMITDALNFVLGRRAPKDFVRQGASSALVTCAVYCAEHNKHLLTALFSYIDDDNLMVIERSVDETGKSACKINGRTVSLGVLKDIAGILFDIHSQHEHQGLLNAARHIDILDRFCSVHQKKELASLAALCKQIRVKQAEADELAGGSHDEREALIGLYDFQVNEIEEAALKPGEDEQLAERRRLINNREEIAEKTNAAIRALTSGGNAACALDLLIQGQKALTRLAALDGACAHFAEEAEETAIRLDDLGRALRAYKGSLGTDADDIKEIEERLDTIYNLKRKYGRTIEDILVFYEKTKAKLDTIANADAKLAALDKEINRLSNEATEICKRVSQARKEAAGIIVTEIEQGLRELEMKDAVFSVSIDKKEEYTNNGFDKVEFMLSANAGEPLKPLAQIASGGEVSRVMLALKAVLSKGETVETLVFDEIDTGVSGRTAQKVAQKLKALSADKQLICITHLPQIAAYADTHILVEKSSKNGKTETKAYNLDEDGTRRELARLIGGAVITGQTEKAAAELRQMAMGLKE